MSEMPELRDGPPWAMEEMILAEPALVAPILASPGAVEAAESIREGGPVMIVGCGTSEHAAMAGATLLGARARDAFEASLDPQTGGVCIAISHEAGTRATLDALTAAQRNGARTVLITARPELADADIVDRHADRGHVVVPHGRVRHPAARPDRDRGRRRRRDLLPRDRRHARPARPFDEPRARSPAAIA